MGMRLGDSISRQKVKPGTLKRIVPYVRPYRWALVAFMLVTTMDAVITVANPLMLKYIIDDGILPQKFSVVVKLSLVIVGLALIDTLAVFLQTWYSARIGQGLILDLRSAVFKHVQRQPLAFFTRAQTGSLVSRLNTDIIGAQQAVTSLFSQALSSLLSLILLLAVMFYLSWQVTLMALVIIPVFVFCGRAIGNRLQRVTREGMQLDAELGSMLNERFNVGGAMLTKLYGRPDEESGAFTTRAGRVRDIAVAASLYGRAFLIVITLLTSLITAGVYGFGGWLAIGGSLKIGTLVALVALLTRLYVPISQLSGMQINVQTALVSFDRVFEVLDLKPLVADRPSASSMVVDDGETAPDIEFQQVFFRYPNASEVSLTSLESIALPTPELPQDAWVLEDVTFRAPGGQVTALVGPSGAGKTTITHLVPRLYDPGEGTVRIGGHDLKDLAQRSVHDIVGVIPQDTYLFHDTIRVNLQYARPDSTEEELTEACKAARIWDAIASMPNGLETVVGDRGYRLSGGEKQRIALARLLLKAPPIVILDEATAHLDSESELAIQHTLDTMLAGRTTLVIAHRLSTVLEADQILVVDGGRIVERGKHDELLAEGGLYAQLYRTQFARQPANAR